MIRLYKVLRALLFTLLTLIVVLPVCVYIALSTPWAREQLRTVAQESLTELLGTDVRIGDVEIIPFNRLNVHKVEVDDDFGKTALTISDVSARFELVHFIRTGRIVIDYATIDGLDAKIYKASDDAPLNIAGIIKKLKGEDKKKEPAKFSLAVNTVIIHNASARYDVLDAPATPGRFNARHICASDLEVTAYLPTLSDHEIEADLQQLSFKEACGLELSHMSARVNYTPTSLSVSDIEIALPETYIALGDIALSYDTPNELARLGKETAVNVAVLTGSYVTPSDLKAFLPALSTFDDPYRVTLTASGTLSDIALGDLRIEGGEPDAPIAVAVHGRARNLDRKEEAAIENMEIDAKVSSLFIGRVCGLLPEATACKFATPAAAAGNVMIRANVDGTLSHIDSEIIASTASGDIEVNAVADRVANGVYDLVADASLQSIDLGRFTGRSDLGPVTANLETTARLGKGIVPVGAIDLTVDELHFRGRDYAGIVLHGECEADSSFTATLDYDNPIGRIAMAGHGNYNTAAPNLSFGVALSEIDPSALGFNKYPGYKLDAIIDGECSGVIGKWLTGRLGISQFEFTDRQGDGMPLHIEKFNVDFADNVGQNDHFSVESDFLNGTLEGKMNIYTIGRELKSMVAAVMPALFKETPEILKAEGETSDFNFEFELANAENISRFLHLPVEIVYPVDIDGTFNYNSGILQATVDAPYLQQGDKIIDSSVIGIGISRDDSRAHIYATTNTPTQKGPMALATSLVASDNRIDAKVNWLIERQKAIGGDMSLSALLGRTDDGAMTATVNFNPGDISFGDQTWSIASSSIDWQPHNLAVNGFSISSGNQSIVVDGVADDNPASLLTLTLNDIELVKIFETLDINKALIGGRATGTFEVRNLFSGAPIATCNDLHVKDIGYNYCILGDAILDAHWDNDTQSVYLDADIVEQEQGRHSRIYGTITPAGEKLDIHIDANHTRLGFMKPFMSAFAADVDGYASGNAHLFGTFKYIDLEGDLLAEKIGLKIDFTNTWYYAENDSVHLRPGIIDIKDITIKDAYGHTARLNGFVRHTFFKEPVFDFRITDARDFLSYDVGPKQSEIWYGRIFGNGSATVNGRPGVVNIGVDMATAPNSTFTFVLSDTEEADDYNFITFRDVTPHQETDTIIHADPLPRVVREYRDRQLAKAAAADAPSDYNMDFKIDITPDANMIIVMDPIGGDEINATGHGNLRLTYQSKGNDLHMYGSYTIDRGKYNFTLQDIIVKDFTIKEGSTISFTGDPYAASLDIKAVYSVNANLSDLDESFLNDRDLNRTNVPVHAVLIARGDMRQPDVSFDLEFPTLTSDIDRKVRSIISTEEMMNQQIIYLLALNRFYTPDYMSTTKGNELFSVASSTLSSQLTSMLGKISDKWSIAPNLRSDYGDFSHMEVDVGLQSSLLNDRLRLHGNLGYRDRTVSTNQFIGDLDVEYLLNRKGTWRLKAYNRYNDQNFYLRTANTTQGVGIMFKRDFDVLFNFLRPRRKSDTPTLPTDSVASPAAIKEEE